MPLPRSVLNAAALATVIGLGVIGLGMTAGCGEEDPRSGNAGTGEPAADGTAEGERGDDAPPAISLGVTADKTHAVQPGDEIRIEVDVEGFVLDGGKIGAGAEPGTGHYHVHLGDTDGEPLLVSAEPSAVVKVPDDVTDGTHALRIRLRHHDHSPLDPPVEAEVRLIIYRL